MKEYSRLCPDFTEKHVFFGVVTSCIKAINVSNIITLLAIKPVACQ